MLILLISLVICLALFVSSLVLINIRRPRKQKGELLRLLETSFTAVMGGMLIAMAVFILYAKFTDSTLGGSDLYSYIYIAGFAVFSSAGGSAVMLFTFLKMIIAYEDKVVYVSMTGTTTELNWNEILEVKAAPLSNKVTLIGADTRIAIGGEPKTYRKFLNIAKGKIKRAAGSEVIEKQLNRSMF